MQTTLELFEIAKGLAKIPQQTSRIFILKIWSTTDLKINNFIVFNMKGVLQTYFFL